MRPLRAARLADAVLYAQYKPLRNFLRGFNLWSGLGTVYCYTQYLKFKRALPTQLTTPSINLGRSNVRAGLHGHLIEILARELILNSQEIGGKPLNTAEAAFKSMSMIHRIDDKSWKMRDTRSDDITLQLSRMAFQQFPWQAAQTTCSLARYHNICSHPQIAPMIEAEFGMTTGELFQLILLLTGEMLERPTLTLEFLSAAERSIREPVLALFERISCTAKGLRDKMLNCQSYDVNWAYSFNALRDFPLVHAGNPSSALCPVPAILMQRLTDGLYIDLLNADKHFGNAIGKAFEYYVGKVARRIGDNKFDLKEEVCWGKPERRSVDWIISDTSASLFVECKLGRLDISSQIEISPEPPFVVAITRLAKNIGQLYATLAEALSDSYPHWKRDGRPVHPVLVMFHEWFCFGPFFYSHLDKLVNAEFVRRRLDHTLLTHHPYLVCSIAEFEGLLTAGRQASIDIVVSEKMSNVHRHSLMRGFLAERYPSSLGNLMGTFDDGMDIPIEGPSRLTRR